MSEMCPFCGSYSKRSCDLIDEGEVRASELIQAAHDVLRSAPPASSPAPDLSTPERFDGAAELRLFKDEFGRPPHTTRADGKWTGWLTRAKAANAELAALRGQVEGAVKALESTLAWFTDPELGKWSYTEGAHFYQDVDNLAKQTRTALASLNALTPKEPPNA